MASYYLRNEKIVFKMSTKWIEDNLPEAFE
jgi:hypothetical protein